MQYLETVARNFSEASGEKAIVEGSSLILPQGIAEGRYDFYCLEPGLSACFINCRFFQEVRFFRKPLPIDDFVVFYFNLNFFPIWLKLHNADAIDIGKGWSDRIFISTSANEAELLVPEDGNVRAVMIYASKEWLYQNYGPDSPAPFSPLFDFVFSKPPSTADLDLKLLLLAKEALTADVPGNGAMMYYSGYSRRLIALLADSLLSSDKSQETLAFKDVLNIIREKEFILGNLEKPLPVLDDIAAKCSLNKTKFSTLFKSIYLKNYSDFFGEIRMKKAAGMLLSGHSVAEAGQSVGYKNLSHFSKAFKEFYNIMPKAYQQTLAQKTKARL